MSVNDNVFICSGLYTNVCYFIHMHRSRHTYVRAFLLNKITTTCAVTTTSVTCCLFAVIVSVGVSASCHFVDWVGGCVWSEISH